MRPSQVSKTLRQIAAKIDNSKNPKRELVAADLKRILAAIGTPKSCTYFWEGTGGGYNLGEFADYIKECDSYLGGVPFWVAWHQGGPLFINVDPAQSAGVQVEFTDGSEPSLTNLDDVISQYSQYDLSEFDHYDSMEQFLNDSAFVEWMTTYDKEQIPEALQELQDRGYTVSN
jgi:hypothetical protein